MQSEIKRSLDADFERKGNIKKIQKMRAPGPAVTIGESIAKEIRTIGSLVPEIWHSQFSPSKLRLFCVYLCFDKFFANSNNDLFENRRFNISVWGRGMIMVYKNFRFLSISKATRT